MSSASGRMVQACLGCGRPSRDQMMCDGCHERCDERVRAKRRAAVEKWAEAERVRLGRES